MTKSNGPRRTLLLATLCICLVLASTSADAGLRESLANVRDTLDCTGKAVFNPLKAFARGFRDFGTTQESRDWEEQADASISEALETCREAAKNIFARAAGVEELVDKAKDVAGKATSVVETAKKASERIKTWFDDGAPTRPDERMALAVSEDERQQSDEVKRILEPEPLPVAQGWERPDESTSLLEALQNKTAHEVSWDNQTTTAIVDPSGWSEQECSDTWNGCTDPLENESPRVEIHRTGDNGWDSRQTNSESYISLLAGTDDTSSYSRNFATPEGGYQAVLEQWHDETQQKESAEVSSSISQPFTSPSPAESGLGDDRIAGAASVAVASINTELKCTDDTPMGTSCWWELDEQPGCHVWNDSFRGPRHVTWAGTCSGSFAVGNGSLTEFFPPPPTGNGQFIRESVGMLVEGIRQGHWSDTKSFSKMEGEYVDGKRQGHWVHEGGGYADYFEGPYVDGMRQGPLDRQLLRTLLC